MKKRKREIFGVRLMLWGELDAKNEKKSDFVICIRFEIP
jgi:hypothetical protein